MEIAIDEDVKAVAEFMLEHVAANRLVAVAKGMAAIAPLFWGQHRPEEIQTLRLVAPKPTISVRGPHKQSSANG